ncbi:MAG TPA: PilZ domain-containing protein [Methylococcaceae bacterium]|nr:PilZ domain-containing protein [Methylococcaceae bacterium]
MFDDKSGFPLGEEANVSLTDKINERRRYFRIDDDIILFPREVAADQVPQGETFQEHALDSFSLSSRLDLLTVESRSHLRRIERDHPAVADFLKILEQKIDLVARALLSSETDMASQRTSHVSLSASGLAFDVDTGFNVGDVLELKMILPPALVGIIAFGRVVYCKQNRDEVLPPFHVAVDFIGLRERDRELLIRHIVKKQLQQLRDKKQDPS